jgi:HlyD family secretion protein
MSRTRVAMLLAGLVVVLGLATFPLLNRRDSVAAREIPQGPEIPTVEVARIGTRTMKRVVRLSGALQSGNEASLAPKQGGKIVAVPVQEGDSVSPGTPLVRIDDSDLRRQYEQARGGVASARAALNKAIEGERLKRGDIERRIAEAQRGVDQAKLQVQKAEAGIAMADRGAAADIRRAEAGVDAAKSGLAKAKKGARPEERKQAQLQVESAQRALDAAKKNLDDTQFLYEKGGVPRVQLDQARRDFEKAENGLEQAKTQLALVESGATAEDIAAAEAQVRTAEAALAAAKAAASRDDVNAADLAAAKGRQKDAEAGLAAARASRAELGLSRADIAAARGAYEQAVAAARLAQQQIASAVLTSPVRGVVTKVDAHVGEMAGPGRPLVTVVGAARVYLEASAPARMVGALRAGQPTTVTLDSLPDRSFQGSVRDVSTVAGSDGRSYPVRIDIDAPEGLLKPGSLGRAAIDADTYVDALVVPPTALRSEGERTVIWVVRGEKVVEVEVQSPLQDERSAMVRGDVSAGEQVVVAGAPGVMPGDTVKTRSADGA